MKYPLKQNRCPKQAKIFDILFTSFTKESSVRSSDVDNMDRKPGHLTKSVQEIAGSLFWIKVVLYFIGKGQHVSISKVVEHASFAVLSFCVLCIN